MMLIMIGMVVIAVVVFISIITVNVITTVILIIDFQLASHSVALPADSASHTDVGTEYISCNF